MQQRELNTVQLNDIVSRKPGVANPLKADVGDVVHKTKHSFTVIWADSALPPDTFWSNSDDKLETITLHTPDFH